MPLQSEVVLHCMNCCFGVAVCVASGDWNLPLKSAGEYLVVGLLIWLSIDIRIFLRSGGHGPNTPPPLQKGAVHCGTCKLYG